jgi:hypothetical protein
VHSGLYQLLEGLSGLDALVLARVSDEQNTVLRADSFEEVTHLFGAGKARLIDHIQVTAMVARRLLGTTGQEALEGISGNACVAELMRGAGCRGEAFNLITALFRSFSDSK